MQNENHNETINIFETFSGIGAQCKALSNLGLNFKSIGISEWNIKSIIAYAMIHHEKEMTDFVYPDNQTMIDYLNKFTFSLNGKTPCKKIPAKYVNTLYAANNITKNLASILDVKGTDIDGVDLLTYSFPCQDISSAGLRRGFDKNSKTSSSMLWEIERILSEASSTNNLPSYLLMENVEAILDDKNNQNFNKWLMFLKSLGYVNYYDVLNASDFGVPQYRKRCFVVSIHKNNRFGHLTNFRFNKGYQTSLRFSDIRIEEDARKEKYNLGRKIRNNPFNYYTLPESKFNTKAKAFCNDSIVHTLTCSDQHFVVTADEKHVRKINSKERLLLMGFTSEDYEKLKQFSSLEIAKMTGNSIVVSVLESIFEDMFLKNHLDIADIDM